MTCKNCIHEAICNKLCPNGLLPYQSSDYPAEIFCLEFKNQEDIVHGEWINNNNGTFTCSACGGRASKMKYCGNCGAKMDGGK